MHKGPRKQSGVCMESHARVWLLNLVVPGRYGRWATSAIIFALLYGCFAVLGVFAVEQPATVSSAAALFFCAILAYIIPIYHYITERAEAELRNLAPVLVMDDAERGRIASLISSKHRRWHVSVACVGLLLGLGHNAVLADSPTLLLKPLTDSPAAAAIFAATMLVWLVMTFALAGLIDNAIIFARLAKRSTIDLLDTAALTPFARVAVSSTLAVIGAQASFPLMLIGGQANPWTFVPGLGATLGPMFILFALPLLPIHRAIAVAKQGLLRDLNDSISSVAKAGQKGLAQPDTAERLYPLLTLRREIQQVSEWPFDASLVTRLGLYLIIPPITWVGAALIDNLIQALI